MQTEVSCLCNPTQYACLNLYHLMEKKQNGFPNTIICGMMEYVQNISYRPFNWLFLVVLSDRTGFLKLLLPDEGNKKVSGMLHEKHEAIANVQNISQNESKLTSHDNFYYISRVSNFTEMHSVVSEMNHSQTCCRKETASSLSIHLTYSA